MLERKTLKRIEWKELTGNTVNTISIENSLFKGYASLMSFTAIEKDVVIPNGLVIARNGYSWLHIAPIGEHFWLTAMFNNEGILFEEYFDITLENDFSNIDNPSFIDLKLDLVINNDEEIVILDEDELKDSLVRNEITNDDYLMAILAASKIMKWYKDNKAIFRSYLYDLYRKLKTN